MIKINIKMKIDGRNSSDVKIAKEIIGAICKTERIKPIEEDGCEGSPDAGLPYIPKPITPENFHGLREVPR